MILPCIETILIKSFTLTGIITWPPFTPLTLSILNVKFKGIGVEVILTMPGCVITAIVFKLVFINSIGVGVFEKLIADCCPAFPTSVYLIAKIIAESGSV